jgi:hypothetical protein
MRSFINHDKNADPVAHEFHLAVTSVCNLLSAASYLLSATDYLLSAVCCLLSSAAAAAAAAATAVAFQAMALISFHLIFPFLTLPLHQLVRQYRSSLLISIKFTLQVPDKAYKEAIARARNNVVNQRQQAQ